MSGLFWLSDEQWAAIEPHLLMVHTGPRRVDDRRVISGIVHRFREGCRWQALPPEYGLPDHGLQPLEPLEPAGALAGHLRGPCRLRRSTRSHDDRQLRGEGTPLGRGRQKGGEGDACRQAIARSRGGRTTKIPAPCDAQGRPHAILLTGGNIADITAAASLVSAAAPSAELVCDKGYDAN